MLGPFNHVPPPRDKADQQVALVVLLVVLALSLLISVLSWYCLAWGANLFTEEAERSVGWSHLI